MAQDDLKSKAGDFLKGVIGGGLGSIFLTEESLRKAVTDFKLPKEILSGLLEGANKTKRDLVQTISQEVVDKIMKQVDVKALINEFAAENEIELDIKIKVHPKGASSKTKKKLT